MNFKNAQPLLWQIPLTYSVVGLPAEASAEAGETPATLLMTDKAEALKNIPGDRALKLNVNGAGNYRVEYDDLSWQLLLKALPKLGVEDRVNLDERCLGACASRSRSGVLALLWIDRKVARFHRPRRTRTDHQRAGFRERFVGRQS